MDGNLCALDAYISRYSHDYEIERYLEREMAKVKKKALYKIELIVHPNFTHDAARAFVKAYREDCAEAGRIFDELEITEEEIYALEDSFDDFKTIFEKNHKCAEFEDGYLI